MCDKLNLPENLRTHYELAIGDPKNVYPPFQAKDIIMLCKALSDARDENDTLGKLLNNIHNHGNA